MTTLHVFSNRHIKNEVHNIKKGDIIFLEDSLSEKRWSLYFKFNDIDENKLGLVYTEWLEDKKMFDFSKVIVKGNPPYNDGSEARNPIYQKFLEKLAKGQPKSVIFVIPTNWFSQDHNALGKLVRQCLAQLGLYKIQLNPVDLFENATVGTCTIFCKKGYSGKVELFDKVTGKSRIIDDLSKQIIPVADPIIIGMLDRLKPANPYTTYPGSKGNTNKFRVVTSYRKERFDLEPLNQLKIIEPNYKSQGGYRVFAEYNTLKEAEQGLLCLSSIWHSKLVKTIMRKTRTSTTLDNPQLRWVPIFFESNKIYTDDEIYQLANCTKQEIEVIEYDNQ